MGKETVTPFAYNMGIQLQKMRDKLNLTQKDVANAIGVNNSFISKCERGVRLLQVDEIAKLCATYGLNYGYFFADEPMRATLNTEGMNEEQVERLNKLLGSSFFHCLMAEQKMVDLCWLVDNFAPFVYGDAAPKDSPLTDGFASTLAVEAAAIFTEIVKSAIPLQYKTATLPESQRELYAAFQQSQALFAKLWRNTAAECHEVLQSPAMSIKYPRTMFSITQGSKADSGTDRKGGGKA